MKGKIVILSIILTLVLPITVEAQVRAICTGSGAVKCNETFQDERGESCVGTAPCVGGYYCEPDYKGGTPLTWDGAYHCSTKLIQSAEGKPIFFTPQITLPGSQFIAGEPIVVTGATLGEWISALYFYLVGAAGILSAVMIMYGGVRYVFSFGNQQKMSAASDQIVSAMVGLMLTLGAYMLLLTVNPALVKFNGLSVPRVPRDLQDSDNEARSYSVRGKPSRPWTGQNVTDYDTMIAQAAATYGVNRNVMKAIMLIESSGLPDADSDAGACGLMQLLPSTAGLTCTQLKDPQTNITAGAIYLGSLFADTCPGATSKHPCASGDACREGDFAFIAAAYNGGRGANYCSTTCPGQTWWQCTQNEGYAETRDYVLKFQEVLNTIQTKGW